MATKQEIMEALLADKAKKEQGGKKVNNGGDNASYPFWNIDVGATATVRFLPDGDLSNTFFWRKREVIKLPFEGVDGGEYPTNKQVTVTVPCMHMWEERCPIIDATKSWWNDPAKKSLAQTYWKKKSYIFQGFVVASPFEEENAPENPIRRLVINPSIFEIIEKSLLDPEMEDMPTDYIGGVDFRIRKTKKGDYSNYSTSEWSRKTRSLDDSELTAIEQFKLFDLKEYLGEKPNADRLAAIKQMFQDSVDGRPFDFQSYGEYYRPFTARGDDGADTSGSTSTFSRAAPAATAAVVEDTVAPAAPAPNPHDILEKIKNRTMNKA